MAVSLALHVGGFGAAVGGPAVLHLLDDLRHPSPSATATLHGDTFLPAHDDLTVEAPDTDPGDPGQVSAGTQATDVSRAAGADAKPTSSDGAEKANESRSRGGKSVRGQKIAAAPTLPTSGENGGPASSALYGAVGERSASDLPLAFNRAFPLASSGDPSWVNAQLGAAGEADVTITLDETGHIETVAISCPDGPLASGISRTLSLLRARPFTAKAKVTHLHLSARISPDQVHDGLHGDVFAIGNAPNAFFALSVGRRIDVKIVPR